MTFTRLTLGEPRLKAKLHGGAVTEPCNLAVHTSSDMLGGHGDLEDYETLTGRTELAEAEGPSQRNDLYWTDGTTLAEEFVEGERLSLPFFASKDNTLAEVGKWAVSTASPDTGTRHLRITGHNPESFASGQSQDVIFARGMTCNGVFSVDGWHADVYPAGAVVTFSVRAKATAGSGVSLTVRINGLNSETGFATGQELTTVNVDPLTTSYTTYEVSGIIAASRNVTHIFPNFFVEFDNDTFTNVSVDVDNISYALE